MNKCKCGSYAINPRQHGRVAEKHSDLCDVCYWRAEAAQARADALRWVLASIETESDTWRKAAECKITGYQTRSDAVSSACARLRAIIEKELVK